MKYFVISDIHGHYKEMIDALSNSNFDLNNPNHKLIINGDMFDRGDQSKEVLEFLYPLHHVDKAIIIKGNHEIFLEEFFRGSWERVLFNCSHNGFNKTLLSLIPDFNIIRFEDAVIKLEKQYPYLKEWLANLPYYFETKNYVITHAGLDFSSGDYKQGNFNKAVWTKPEEFFKIDLLKEYQFNKIVVVGHRFTCILRNHFKPNEKNNSSVYFHHDNQKIGIDGGSYYTKHINVFEFEED